MSPRPAAAILLTVLLAAAAAFAAWRQPVVTVITSLPYVIDRPGLYRLGADLRFPANLPANTAAVAALIEITAPDVTLDFHGHTLVGPNDPDTAVYGVFARGPENLVIKDGRITRCYVGIYLHGSVAAGVMRNADHRIENMVLSHDYHLGIYLENAASSQVQGCRISFIGPSRRAGFAVGILATGDGVELSRNLISNVTAPAGDAFGIFCNGATGVFAVGNIVANCQYGISAGKYQGNLTSGCKVSVLSGTDPREETTETNSRDSSRFPSSPPASVFASCFAGSIPRTGMKG